jgi:CRP-like cAMP-binding protein/CheY-like chemotaxis protein
MKNSILIIEDNTDMLENTAELLELAGYNIFKASNGKDGLAAARKNKPDLVLCDVMMPLLDGYGVLQAFENIPEMVGVPFVFTTAKSEKSDFRKGMDLGADDYLTKPFSGDDLLKVVSSRLKKNHLIKNKFANKLEEFDDLLNTAKATAGIDALSEKKTIKKVRKKDLLFMEGHSANFLYIIMSGKIKIFKSNEWGKEFIIDIYKQGDFLGYIALMENKDHSESAMAIEDCEVALIHKDDFLKLFYSNNDVSLKFIKLISNNYFEMEERLLKLAYDSARKRVAEALLFVSKKYQKDDKHELSFSLLRENISAIAGISRESVSRNLTDFKEEGLIDGDNGSIKILDFKKLKNLKN